MTPASSSEKPRLCQVCLDTIFADGSADELGSPSPHHKTQQSIIDAIDSGCHICSQIDDLERGLSTHWKLSSENGGFGIQILRQITEVYSVDSLDWLGGVEGLITPVAAHDRSFELARLSLNEPSTGNERVLDLAKYWLEECHERHPLCKKNFDPPAYPTRLLDISSACIELAKTKDSRPSGPYATLSYRWGLQPFLMLTASNETRLQRGLAIDDLPQIFRDIITAARYLKIRYLWIDCLCIMQSGEGSAAEWERECATMDQVYENSILNFCVTNAQSPNDKCFTTRQTDTEPAVTLDWKPMADEARATYHVQVGHGPALRRYNKFWESEVFKRGWILQERLLCPRVLYFDNSRISWECSGYGGRAFMDESRPAFPPAARDDYTTSADEQPWSPEQEDTTDRTQWSHIVGLYSEMSLTYPDKDKLLALSGVAKRMAKTLSMDYVAGVFCKKDLLQQLLWTAPNRGTRSSKWRAPSWSWASLDGEILFEQKSHEAMALASIIEMHLELFDPRNPYGALQSASLQIRCCPMAIERAAIVDSNASYDFYRWPSQITLPTLDAKDPTIKMRWTPDDEKEANPSKGPFIIVLTELRGAEVGTPSLEHETIGIALSPRQFVSSSAFSRFYFAGLLLEELPDRSGAFRRLGRVTSGEYLGVSPESHSFSKRQALELLDVWAETPERAIELV